MKALNRLPAAALALLAVTFAAAAAYAQDTVISAEPTVALFLPYLDLIIRGAIAALVPLAAAYIWKKWGLEVDKEHRDALQTSLTNAAGLLLQKAAAGAATATINVRSPAMAEAVRYVQNSAPDALRKWGLTPEAVAEKILAKIPQIENSAGPAPMSTPVMR